MSNVIDPLGELDPHQKKVLAIVNIVSASLSILGSASIIVSTVFFRKICFREIYPLFQLSVAHLLASVLFVTSSTLYMTRISHPCYCKYIDAVMTSFYTSTVFLMFIYTLETFLRIRKRRMLQESVLLTGSSRSTVSYKPMHVLYIVWWIVPLAVCFGVLNYQNTGCDLDICLPVFHNFQNTTFSNFQTFTSYKTIFLIPLILTSLINPILYIGVIKTFHKLCVQRGLYSFSLRQDEKSVKRKVILYQSVFLVCWLPTIALGLMTFDDISRVSARTYFALYIVQATLGPLHGFLISIIYGWTRQSFRRTLSKLSLVTDLPSLSITL